MNCPSCGTANAEGARFCMSCGSALPAAGPLQGERKYATVLFADVVGSTALAERLDPEEWAEVMNGAFVFMNATVTRFGGTVGRLMGDAVLAFFGAPLAQEDHAERAVRAGLAMQEAAAAYAERLRASHGFDFHVRVGISTGLVVFTMVGDRAKTEYTAMGDAANVAARLQTMAPEGAVLVSAETLRLTRDLVKAHPAGSVPVKGRKGQVDTYRVVGVRSGTGSPQGAVGAPLVGRDAELGVLRERLEAVAEGRGGWVAVRGEAGLGKSRLLAELREDALAASPPKVRWLEGRGLSYAQSVSYDAWQQVIRHALGLTVEDGAPVVRRRLREAFTEAGPDAEAARPFLEALLGVEDEQAASALDAVEPSRLGGRLADAVRGFLEQLLASEPLVLVLDDLHWADTATLELLLEVAELVRRTPLLVISLYRPDRAAPSGELAQRARERVGEEFVLLDLQPLGTQHAAGMLGHLLAADGIPPELRERILSRSDGNPLFLEEVVRALKDSGYLLRDGDRWRAAGDVEPVEIPGTLLGVLTARIDRLPEATKRVAQTAAVIGRTFAHRVLATVCEDAPREERIADVDPHLGTLTREEVLRERSVEPERLFTFKHVLSQEAAYDGLLLRRRRELHARTAQVLERIYAGREQEQAPLLAYHYLRAEDWPRGAHYAHLAARRAMRLFAVRDAIAAYEKALAALDRVEAPDPQLLIEVTLDWARVSVYGRRQEQLEHRQALLDRLDTAERIARPLGDRRRLARVLAARGNVLIMSGLPALAVDALMEASKLASDVQDESLTLLPFFISTEWMVDHDPGKAVEQFDEVIRLAREFDNVGIVAHSLATKALAHARIGEYPQARAALEEALRLAPSSGAAIKEADVNIVAGMVFYELGEVERGVAHGQLGTRQAVEVHGFQCACSGYFVSGSGRLRSRHLEEALSDFRTSREYGGRGDAQGMETYMNLASAGEAMAFLAEGQEEAIAHLERALANARSLGDAYGSATLAQELGGYLLRQGEPERAHEQFAAALAYYREAGMKPYVARIAAPAAEALEALGREEEGAALREEGARLSAELARALALAASNAREAAPDGESPASPAASGRMDETGGPAATMPAAAGGTEDAAPGGG